MSTWTHINGSIRYDGLGDKKNLAETVIKPLLGNTCGFSDPTEVWDKCTVPCGSEGSVQLDVLSGNEDITEGNITSGDTSGGRVLIHGDLRDYSPEDWQEVRDWFKKITSPPENSGLWVRQAVLQLESYETTEILEYKKPVEPTNSKVEEESK